jgi:hypothetical protein
MTCSTRTLALKIMRGISGITAILSSARMPGREKDKQKVYQRR